MADLAPPLITSAIRVANGGIQVRYTAPVSGYTQVYFFLRPAGGGFQQASSTTTLNGGFTLTSIAGTPLDAGTSYALYMTAKSSDGRVSGPSKTVTVAAWSVVTPRLLDAVRIDATTAELTFENVGDDARVYAYRRATPGGIWGQGNAIDAKGWAGKIRVPNLSGNSGYEFRIRTGQYGLYSDYTSEKSAEAWWQLPNPATNLEVKSRTATSLVVAWQGTSTPRNPVSQIKVRWQPLTGGAWRERVQTAWSITIPSAPELGWRVQVIPYSPAGPASSVAELEIQPLIQVPEAQPQPTVTWKSGAVELSWAPVTSTAKPVTSTAVIRRNAVTGQSVTVGNAPAGATTFRDAPPANGVFTYALLARNAAGAAVAMSPVSDPIATIPTGIRRVEVTKIGFDVLLTWYDSAPTVAAQWHIEHTTSALGKAAPEATWFPVADRPVGDRSWMHIKPAVGMPHTYRVRPTHPSMPAGLVAPWVYTETVPAASSPASPRVERPERIDPALPTVIEWEFRSTDGSPQTKAVVRYQQGSAEWKAITVTGATSSVTIPPGTFVAGQRVYLNVVTYGQGDTYSAPGYLTFTPATAPRVGIVYPTQGVLHPSRRLAVTWSTDAQVSYRVRLLGADGVVVDARSAADPDARQVAFDGVAEGRATVQVEVHDGVQWSPVAEATFEVRVERPAPPQLEAIPDDDQATVALRADPVNALAVMRRNYAAAMLGIDWENPSGGRTGERVVWVAGDVEREGIGLDLGHGRVFLYGNSGGSYAASLSLTLSSPSPGLKVLFSAPDATGQIPADEPYVDVPVWPETVRVTRVAPPGYNQWRLSSDAPGTLGIFDPLHQWITNPAAPPSTDFFDHRTVADGYTYGRKGQGYAWEAGQGESPLGETIALPMTERIEILRDGQSIGDVAADGTLLDRFPPTGVPVTYVARAWTLSEAYADSAPHVVTIASDWVQVAYGEGLRSVARGRLSPTLTVKAGRERVARRYAGHDTDTVYWGPRQPRSISASVTVADDDGSTLPRWLEAAEYAGTVIYRDPAGNLLQGALEFGGWGGSSSIQQEVSITVTEAQG